MTKYFTSFLMLSLLAISNLHAQNETRSVSLRLRCFQFSDETREISVLSGKPDALKLVKFPLYISATSDAQEIKILGNQLTFVQPISTDSDPKGYRVIATAGISSGSRQLAILMPSGVAEKPYKAIALDETEKVIPMGSTFVYNLTRMALT